MGTWCSFHCNARMVRRADGRPWFIHGVGFDITDLKRTEEALQEERNFASAVLDTVGALVLVLDPGGGSCASIARVNGPPGTIPAKWPAGRSGTCFAAPERRARFREIFEQLRAGRLPAAYESAWETRQGARG